MAARLVQGGAVDPGALLVPVPLHPTRMRERGYNQAERLARAVARATGAEVRTDILVRRQAGTSQTRLDREARRASVAGAFAVRGRSLDKPDGRPIIVVDDVWTTGATSASCRRALEDAGWAGPVRVLVGARTPLPFGFETPSPLC